MSRILKGTVRAANTQRRIENATVRLEPAEQTGDLKDVKPAFRNTDDDGDFSFDVSDVAKWPEGTYALTAFHPDAGPGSAQKKVTLSAGEPPGFHWLELPDTEISNAHGAWFFAALFIALAALVVAYLLLHEQVTDTPTPIDAELTETIHLAQAQATEATQLDSSALVVQTINLADSLFQSARRDTSLFSPQKAARVAGLLAQAREASYADDSTGLGTILHSIEQSLLQPTTPFFWSQLPWRLAEILFWALGATIIRLLLNTGYYLRKRVFFKHAIAHHLSFVITVPPMALLIAFILSLVQVSFVISDVTLHLDMNNVYISIVVAALIGIAPWKAWDFVSTLADKLFERITPSSHDEEQSPADTASDSS